MAKRVLSMIWRSVAAGSSKRVGSSPSAITGKSSRGSVDRLKRERPATTCILPSAALSSTWLPSGSLRTISKKVWAGTVVAPAWLTWAGTLSSTCRSRSVAIKRSDPSSRASMSTLDRMGMVLRRSTTDWTWPRLFNRVARSIVAFMPLRPLPQSIATAARLRRALGRYNEPVARRQWEASGKDQLGISTASTWWMTPLERLSSPLVIARLAARGVGEDDLVAFLGRGQGAAAHGRQHGLALAGVDRLADVVGKDRARQDMIGEQRRSGRRALPASSACRARRPASCRRPRRRAQARCTGPGRRASRRGRRPCNAAPILLSAAMPLASVSSPAASFAAGLVAWSAFLSQAASANVAAAASIMVLVRRILASPSSWAGPRFGGPAVCWCFEREN